MKAKELKGLSKTELSEKLVELRKELMREYAQLSTGTIPKSPAKLSQTRRHIARIKTIMNNQEDPAKQ